MAYIVYYKDPRSLFWRKIKGVENEGFVATATGIVMPAKYFVKKDKTIIEVPSSCVIKYSPSRYFKMQERLEKLKQRKDRIKKKGGLPSSK